MSGARTLRHALQMLDQVHTAANDRVVGEPEWRIQNRVIAACPNAIWLRLQRLDLLALPCVDQVQAVAHELHATRVYQDHLARLDLWRH